MSEKVKQYVYEEQTDRYFEIKKEQWIDKLAARVSIIYLVIMVFFFLWQLFDIWLGRFTLAKIFGYFDFIFLRFNICSA